MARKKTKKAAPRRRRRMGAASSKTDLTMVLAAIGGGVAARVITTMLPDDLGKTDITSIKPFVPVALGYFLPNFVKMPIAKPFAMGLMVGGSIDALQKLEVLDAIAGYVNAPMIGMYDNYQMRLMEENRDAPYVAGSGMCYSG